MHPPGRTGPAQPGGAKPQDPLRGPAGARRRRRLRAARRCLPSQGCDERL